MNNETKGAFLNLIKRVGDPAHECDLLLNCLSSSSSGEIDIYFDSIPNLSEPERKSINNYFKRSSTKSTFINHCGIREHKSHLNGLHKFKWTFHPRTVGVKMNEWYLIVSDEATVSRPRRPNKRARVDSVNTRPDGDERQYEARVVVEGERVSSLNQAVQEGPIGAVSRNQLNDQVVMPTVSATRAAVREMTIRISTSAILRFIGEHGRDPPLQNFDRQSSFMIAMDKFLKSQVETQLLYCSICSQRKWPDNFSIQYQRMPQQSQLKCLQCVNDKGDIKRLSKENLMHPMAAPNLVAMEAFLRLPTLLTAEEMLLSPYQPIMRVYRLKGGSLGFSGCCVNLPHNIEPMCTSI